MSGSLPPPGPPAGVLAAVWLALAGCGPEPAGPADPPAELSPPSAAAVAQPEAPARMLAMPATRESVTKPDFSDEIADLRRRFLPSLEPRAREVLAQALEDLATRTADDDPAGAAAVLARGAGALREGDAGPADLDALRRTLEGMRATLKPSSPDLLTRSGGTDDPRAR